MGETEKSAALFNLAKTALDGKTSDAGVDEVARLLQQETQQQQPLARSASNGLQPPPPLLARASSVNSRSNGRDQEWRRFLTVEERRGMREKIRSAYQNACDNDYDRLLATVVAIEEELLHISAPSRLDYFKSGCQFDKRVHEKRKQFINNDANGNTKNTSDAPPQKKSRSEHN